MSKIVIKPEKRWKCFHCETDLVVTDRKSLYECYYFCKNCKTSYNVNPFGIKETSQSIRRRLGDKMICQNCLNWIQGAVSDFCSVNRDDDGLIERDSSSRCISPNKFKYSGEKEK